MTLVTVAQEKLQTLSICTKYWLDIDLRVQIQDFLK